MTSIIIAFIIITIIYSVTVLKLNTRFYKQYEEWNKLINNFDKFKHNLIELPLNEFSIQEINKNTVKIIGTNSFGNQICITVLHDSSKEIVLGRAERLISILSNSE